MTLKLELTRDISSQNFFNLWSHTLKYNILVFLRNGREKENSNRASEKDANLPANTCNWALLRASKEQQQCVRMLHVICIVKDFMFGCLSENQLFFVIVQMTLIENIGKIFTMPIRGWILKLSEFHENRFRFLEELFSQWKFTCRTL